MTSAAARAITLAEKIPSAVVGRFIVEQRTDAEAAAAVYGELVKLLLASYETGLSLIPSREVDDAWHTFLSFTRDYEKWCSSSFGRFIHHTPLTAAEDRRRVPEKFGDTVRYLTENYSIDTRYWDEPAWSAPD